MDLLLERNTRLMVHGSVNYTAEEFKIIDHKLFRRLTSIKQLSLLGDVFPSAVHTRFAHSLGVVCVVQQMLDALFKQSRATSSKLRSIIEAEAGQAVRIHEMDPQLARYLQRIARIGGLIHDAGHGPCSHAFEAFSAPVKVCHQLLQDEKFAVLKPLHDEILKGHHGRLAHEAVSCMLFAVIWHDIKGNIKEPWMPLVIASILLGRDKVPGIPSELYEIIPLCRDIISSSPIDADRMEYLRHDSMMCGVTYGLFEKDRILKSILAYRGIIGHTKVFRLGWRDSGLRAVEDFVHARFKMFIEVYHHKTNRAKEIMLEQVAQYAEEIGISPINTSSLDEFTKSYCRLTDEKFLEWISGEEIIGLPRITDARITTIGNNLGKRVLMRRLYEFKRNEIEDAEYVCEEMRKKYPERTFLIDKKPIDAVKGIEKGAMLVDLDGDGKYRIMNPQAWFEQSPQIRTLRNEEKWLPRLYVVVEKRDPAKVKNEMRTAALAVAAKRRVEKIIA